MSQVLVDGFLHLIQNPGRSKFRLRVQPAAAMLANDAFVQTFVGRIKLFFICRFRLCVLLLNQFFQKIFFLLVTANIMFNAPIVMNTVKRKSHSYFRWHPFEKEQIVPSIKIECIPRSIRTQHFRPHTGKSRIDVFHFGDCRRPGGEIHSSHVGE